MTERTVSVVLLLDALAHEEQVLKKLGAFGPADGVRISITKLLRLADETRHSAPFVRENATDVRENATDSGVVRENAT